jgi:metal-responsive CopG/Arc/MetJ family transcriptional regulator
MKVKTSVTLSEEIVRAIDEIGGNRSRVIEEALSEYLVRRERQQRDARDLDILNRHAASLNREVEDALAYQADL